MAKLQEDWVFIGLGLGALYLVYKLTKPVTDLTQTISDTAQDIVTTGGVGTVIPNGGIKDPDAVKSLADMLAKLFGKKESNDATNSPPPQSFAAPPVALTLSNPGGSTNRTYLNSTARFVFNDAPKSTIQAIKNTVNSVDISKTNPTNLQSVMFSNKAALPASSTANFVMRR